jgi:DNA-3-methyladenine glycosylase I
MKKSRCSWCGNDPLYVAYHDEEWGVPEHDDQRLFELLSLEGAQAGLSWITILRKREGYRRAFEDFDPEAVARFDDARIDALVTDPGIVRHRGKVASVVSNARALLAVQEAFGTFDAYIWGFVDGVPIRSAWPGLSEVPATTPLSEAMSKDLRRRGFKFMGPTTSYAFMQAVGMVNDHVMDCFRYKKL